MRESGSCVYFWDFGSAIKMLLERKEKRGLKINAHRINSDFSIERRITFQGHNMELRLRFLMGGF